LRKPVKHCKIPLRLRPSVAKYLRLSDTPQRMSSRHSILPARREHSVLLSFSVCKVPFETAPSYLNQRPVLHHAWQTSL